MIEKEEHLPDSRQRSYREDMIGRQDAALEQIELILYKMHQLARRAAADGCSFELRQQLQEEMQTLIEAIDQIAANERMNYS